MHKCSSTGVALQAPHHTFSNESVLIISATGFPFFRSSFTTPATSLQSIPLATRLATASMAAWTASAFDSSSTAFSNELASTFAKALSRFSWSARTLSSLLIAILVDLAVEAVNRLASCREKYWSRASAVSAANIGGNEYT